MNKGIRRVTMALSVFLCFCWSTSAFAAESAMKEIFTDSFYGALTGGLVGAAIMAFAKKPADHLNDIGYGAAVGVIAGAAFGAGRALVESSNGRVTMSIPTIIPDLGDTNSKGQTAFTLTANLFRGKF